MLTTVASARSADPLALLDEPLWRLLYHFFHLTERETREALRARMARVDLGYMVAYAFNQPALLDDERRAVSDAIVAYECGPVDEQTDLAALRARGETLAAKIERGRVLSPAALTVPS